METLETLRDAMLERIIATLESDQRFEAAWLAGSFGRGEQDAYSDLDLWVVVAERAAAELCARDRTTGAGAPPERLELFEAFGEPVIVHEQHANAPVGATFTSVYYATGLAVDWTLLPESRAARRPETKLLFERGDTAIIGPPEGWSGDALRDRLGERYAFFWLLALPAAKCWRRGDDIRFHMTLESMHATVRELEHLLRGATPDYSRHSLAPFCPTAAEQRAALLAICRRVQELSVPLRARGVDLPAEPDRVLAAWLAL